MNPIEYLQLLVYGIVLGSIIALAAIGLSLTYGILNFANFAHGDFVTLGAYLTLLLRVGFGLPLAPSLLLAMAGTALLAVAVDKLLYRRLRARGPVTLLIASVGVALIVRNAILVGWGPGNQFLRQGIQFPYRIGGLLVKPDHITIVAIAVLLALGVHLFLQYTKLGKAMRAMADNPSLATVTGIDTEAVITWTWVIGAATAASAGVMLALDTQISPEMGWHMLLSVFAAVLLGGIGSPYGAMAGGLILGISQELSTAFIPTSYKPVVAFVIMIAILLVRPTGIFNTRGAMRV